MKECKHCSTSYEDKLKACPNCGGSAIVTEAEKIAAEEQEQYEKTLYIDNIKNLRKLIFIGAGAILAVILTVVIVVSINNNRVYISTSPNGEQIEMTQKEINTAIDMGTAYLNQKNYEAAIKEFKKVPAVYKDYDKVQVKLADAEGAYRNLLIEQADKYTSEGRFSDALKTIDMALSVLGTDSITLIKQSEINDKYKDDFVARASVLLDENKFTDAIAVLDEATRLFGNDTTLTNKKNDILSKYKVDFFERASVYLEEKKYNDALSILETAKSIFGEDSDILSLILKVNKERILDKVIEFEGSNDYAGAIMLINNELSDVKNDPQIIEKLNAIKITYKENLLIDADNTLNSIGYLEAIDMLYNGLNILSSDNEILSKIDEYKEYAPVAVSSLSYFTIGDGNYAMLAEVKDNYENIQMNVMKETTYSCSRDYLLDGNYSRLSGTLFRSYEGRSSGLNPSITILCDGVKVYEKSIAIGEKPSYFEVNLKGVRVVEIILKDQRFWGVFNEDTVVGGVSELNIYKK